MITIVEAPLRDHSHDATSCHHNAQQRLVTPALAAAASPGVAVIEDGRELVVTWLLAGRYINREDVDSAHRLRRCTER